MKGITDTQRQNINQINRRILIFAKNYTIKDCWNNVIFMNENEFNVFRLDSKRYVVK